jgi:hypothetical protein
MRDDVSEAAIALWRAHGGPRFPVAAEAFAVGGNNRVLKLVPQDGSAPVVAKQYFRGGERDRLASEWRFLRHAVELGVDAVPRPIACDSAAGIGLYEFIAGRRIGPEEVGDNEVLAAAAFVRAINGVRSGGVAADKLPLAGDAGFSVAAHLAITDARVARLGSVAGGSDVDAQAKRLIGELAAWWTDLKRTVAAQAAAEGIDIEGEIPPQERLLSPSDFGFHNILRRDDGRLAFLDFEYAGRDDVAQLVCDFFLQPAVPVGRHLLAPFVAALLGDGSEAAPARRRIRLLHRAFGVRWCCILLNAFVPEAARRGQFADPQRTQDDRKRVQLAKAMRAFDELQEARWPI